MKAEATSEKEETPEIDPTIVALGGVDLEVVHKDGHKEVVKVRILEIEHLYRYVDLSTKERKCADFLCGQKSGWADTLTADSVLDVNDKAYDLNFSLALRWLTRRAAIMEKLAPASAQGHAVASSLSERSAQK